MVEVSGSLISITELPNSIKSTIINQNHQKSKITILRIENCTSKVNLGGAIEEQRLTSSNVKRAIDEKLTAVGDSQRGIQDQGRRKTLSVGDRKWH
jgi:hypothetical protein